MSKLIYVVDDESNIRTMMQLFLENEGFTVETFKNGQEVCQAFSAKEPDMLILDIMMPGIDGLSLCTYFRRQSHVPIIFVSDKDTPIDRVMGITLGSDDYITKPFSPSELTARVDSLYRRVVMSEANSENNFKEELKSGIFTLNLRNRSLTKNGTIIELTQVEFQIMEYFFSKPGTALDRTDILNHVWGEQYVGEEKIVDVNIRRLRMKVEDEPSNPKYIVTVWGLGYKWDA